MLLTCLMAAFQEEILEIAHSFSHHFKGRHSYHSHHADGEDTDHEHAILDITKIAFEEYSDSPDLQDKEQQFSFDKIPPLCVSLDLQTALGGLKNKSIPISNLQLSTIPFLEIIVPPPDFTS
ncbi:MAG: hypothetical protein LH618_01820 [Saprospiraceae bacterium]|nr:hypothetical protein [Saprospiraceae bacterium]